MRRSCACVGFGLFAWLLGGCGTTEWVARDEFGAKYSCPKDQVNVRQEIAATTAKGQPLPGFTDLVVGGCNVQSRYRCHNAEADRGATRNVCLERIRMGIQATDGSVAMAMQGDPDAASATDRAAIASAAHDLPCPRASIRVVARGPTVVEGCGQQITYQEEEHDLTPPPGYEVDGDIKGYRDVMVSRAAAPAPAAAPATAPASTPAPVLGASP
jgi:hypothetical protein